MKNVVATLIALTFIEITVLLIIGHLIGVTATLLLMIATAAIGAYFAKKQGLETLKRAKEQMQYGQMPGVEIVNGICIILGGVLLVLPGFVTDLVGLFLVIPFTRLLIQPIVIRWIMNRMNQSRRKMTIIR